MKDRWEKLSPLGRLRTRLVLLVFVEGDEGHVGNLHDLCTREREATEKKRREEDKRGRRRRERRKKKKEEVVRSVFRDRLRCGQQGEP